MVEKNWKPQVTRYEKLLAKYFDEKGIAYTSNPLIVGYYPDFVIKETNLIVEVDGSVHDTLDQKYIDEKRTAHLKTAGYRIIRFTNWQIVHQAKKVVREVKAEIRECKKNPIAIKRCKQKAKERAQRKRDIKKVYKAKAKAPVKVKPKKLEVVRLIKAES